jgi:hypothetical protein
MKTENQIKRAAAILAKAIESGVRRPTTVASLIALQWVLENQNELTDSLDRCLEQTAELYAHKIQSN